MKVQTLIKIITEEVRKTIRKELKDILVEAVLTSLKTEEEIIIPSTKQKTQPIKTSFQSVSDILQETRKTMSGTDYEDFSFEDIINSETRSRNTPLEETFSGKSAQQLVNMENEGGVNIDALPFVKNAAKIVKLAEEKGKNKHL